MLLKSLETARAAVLKSVPYKAAKLFHLSLLWRADVSSLPQFSGVRLGDRHRERLRLMLLSDDEGSQRDYQVVCSPIEAPDGKGLWGDSIIAPPDKVKVDGHHAYMFTFGACAWLYFVTSHRYKLSDEACLKGNGDMPAARWPWQGFRKYAKWAPPPEGSQAV